MAKTELTLKAQTLRKRGLSIGQIAKEIGVSKSSTSLWCRNVLLTPRQKYQIREKAIRAGRVGRLLGAEANRRKKMNVIAEYARMGKADTDKLTKREFLLIGASIYWGEGSKVGQLSFVNSDKDMVVFMSQWFQHALNVKKDDFILRVFINAQHARRETQLKTYWSRLLDIPVSKFRSTIFIKRPSRKKYANHSKYYGLLTLRMRNSANIKYRILGLIEGLKCSNFERLPT